MPSAAECGMLARPLLFSVFRMMGFICSGKRQRGFLPLLALTLLSHGGLDSAHAGRPMETDDAGIVDAGRCQLETWVDGYRGNTDFWAVPACNPGGHLELSLGGALSRQESSTKVAAVVLQGKTLFKEMQPNGWGLGLAAGVEHHPRSSGGARDWYAYIPFSKSFRDDRLFMHANLGWLHEGAEKQERMTWGLGLELQLAEQSWFSAETFGQDRGKALYQFGFAHWLIPDRVQLDMAYGREFGTDEPEHWFSVGLTLVSLPFLH